MGCLSPAVNLILLTEQLKSGKLSVLMMTMSWTFLFKGLDWRAMISYSWTRGGTLCLRAQPVPAPPWSPTLARNQRLLLTCPQTRQQLLPRSTLSAFVRLIQIVIIVGSYSVAIIDNKDDNVVAVMANDLFQCTPLTDYVIVSHLWIYSALC